MLTDVKSRPRILKQELPEEPLSSTQLASLMEWFFNVRMKDLGILDDYYTLHHEIENRQFFRATRDPDTGEVVYKKDNLKPNNKLIHDFPGYITDVSTGYFMGKPISYSIKENADKNTLDKQLSALQDIFDYNDEQAHNLELATLSSAYGTAFELLWIEDSDNGSKPRLSTLSPLEAFVVYSPKEIEETPLAGFRVISYKDLLTNETHYIVEQYNETEVFVYEGSSTTELVFKEREPHHLKQVPIIEYPNNPLRVGDFENVLSLIDAYDKVNSDGVNECEEFKNSLLQIKNMSGTTEKDIQEIKQTGVIFTEDEGDAKFISKQSNTTADGSVPMESTLTKNIHKFSKVPPLDDQNFANNSSGESMKYKLWGLEQSAATKERYFKKSIQRRIELLSEYLTTLKDISIDFSKVVLKFTRNTPRNLIELAQMINNLRGLVSDETLLDWLPDVDDAQAELSKRRTEALEETKVTDPYNRGESKQDIIPDEPEDDVDE